MIIILSIFWILLQKIKIRRYWEIAFFLRFYWYRIIFYKNQLWILMIYFFNSRRGRIMIIDNIILRICKCHRVNRSILIFFCWLLIDFWLMNIFWNYLLILIRLIIYQHLSWNILNAFKIKFLVWCKNIRILARKCVCILEIIFWWTNILGMVVTAIIFIFTKCN